MSKKKKFRLKAHQKAQILRQLQEDSSMTAPIVSSAQPSTIATRSDNPAQKKTFYAPITPIEDVRKDIKKIGVVVGILTVLLIITVIVDQKYNYSLSIGQKITKGLGI